MPRTRKPYSSSAEECRQRGIKVGDRLTGDEGYGATVIQITAIGERYVLAKMISHNGVSTYRPDEAHWGLSCRDWEVIDVA